MSIRLEALPELVARMQELERRANAEGIFFRVADYGGTRTEADTARILAYRDADYAIYEAKERQAGRTPLPKETWRRIAPYGSSYHNYGAARDLIITAKPGGMTSTAAMDRVATIAPSIGLRRPLPKDDPGHFELAITLADARARWGNYVAAAGASANSAGAATGWGLLLLTLFGLAIAIAKRSS